MRIRLLRTPEHRYGSGWPPVGETMEAPEGLGAHMIEHGEAVLFEAVAVPMVEHVAVRITRPRGRPRKEVFAPKEAE